MRLILRSALALCIQTLDQNLPVKVLLLLFLMGDRVLNPECCLANCVNSKCFREFPREVPDYVTLNIHLWNYVSISKAISLHS